MQLSRSIPPDIDGHQLEMFSAKLLIMSTDVSTVRTCRIQTSDSKPRKETMTRALAGLAAWTSQLWNMPSRCKAGEIVGT